MKNNSHIPFEKYRIKPQNKHIEHKYLNRNYTNENISFDIKNDFFHKVNNMPYSTIDRQPSKFRQTYKKLNDNFNLSEGKIFPSYNKDYSFINNYNTNINQPTEKKNSQNVKNNKNIKLKPFYSYSQSVEDNKRINYEVNKYPSNYSYYEYKYTKKKIEPKNTRNNINNNTLQINSKYNTQNPIERKKISTPYSNYNLNKYNNNIRNKNSNNKYGMRINNTPLTKNSYELQYYHKINKSKINNLVSASDNKKKNIILNNIFNVSNAQLIDEKNHNYTQTYNDIYTKESLLPKTPLVNPNFQVNSPLTKYVNKNYIQKIQNRRNNTTKINFPSKSYDNISKLVFMHKQNNKKNTNTNINKDKDKILSKKKLDIIKNNKKNLNEPIRLNVEKTPNLTKEMKMKNFLKINNILDSNKKYNNNVTISINDTNVHKNIIKKLSFNIEEKSNIKEHMKINSEILSYKQNKNALKDKTNNFQEKNKNIISGIKLLDSNKLKNLSLPKNNIIKSIIYKKINEIKVNNIINPKTENKNKNFKIKAFKLDNDKYNRENENITYDNYTEPTNDFRNSFQEDKKFLNYSINNEKINNIKSNILIKGRIIKNKKINKENNYQINTDYKKNKKNEHNYFINNNNNQNNSNENIFKHQNKSKYQITLVYDSNKINNRPLTDNKPRDSNKFMKKLSSNDIDKNKIKNKISNSLFDSFSMNKITPPKSNNYSNLSKLSINENKKKEPNQKVHKNISDLPIYISRLDEFSKKNENKINKNNEGWEKIQYRGIRKKTYDAGLRMGNKNKNTKKKQNINFFKEQFSSTIYVKASEGLTLAGKNSQGNRKINQDTFVIEKNVNGILNFNIFGVFDGHGDDGHFVSNFVKRYLIYRIKNHPLIKKLDEPKEIYNQLKQNGFYIISKIFIDADVQVQKEKFDCIRSGTTAVLLIQLEEHIICANTGDSRAIAIYDKSSEDNLTKSKVFLLSHDCKPNLPNEKRRIYESGGEVEKAYYSDNENEDLVPFRVWAKGANFPGLAMSRSIGDMDAKKLGVIPNPQFIEYTIDYSSKYILICSDGIWELMSNEEAMKISNKYYLRNDPLGLCHQLSQSSIKLWELRDIVVDDITVLVIFF